MTELAKASNLTVVILTLNEELHIKRCIVNALTVAMRVVVVDSQSTDRTCDIASALGADVFINPFINQSKQFNWALDNTNINTTWVMRLDADEYLTPQLVGCLPEILAQASDGTNGFTLNLRRIFMGKWLRYGSLYPIRLLRIWRVGSGRCEERWMDEHVVVQGRVEHIDADFVDDNRNSITWWTDKHNRYASREAVELLNLKYGFLPITFASLQNDPRTAFKRWLKEKVYVHLPRGVRALAYFIYRYLIRFGFLDGQEGTVFHCLQGFWYRYLVDVKFAEVEGYMRCNKVDVVTAIYRVLNIKLQ